MINIIPMKYFIYLFGIGAVITLLFGINKVLAEDIGAITQNELNTSYPTNLISQNPQTQEEANALIDTYIKQSFGDSYYTEKSSVGEIKLVVQDKYLLTKQQIDFATINYHIDKSFIFDGAQYSWKITRGDNTVFEIANNRSNFFYTFNEVGTYTIEVRVNSNGVVKTGSITLDIFDKVSLDYRPLNPGKGDVITVSTELPVSQYSIEWKIDGQNVSSAGNTITFTENKGYGQNYTIEAIAKDKNSGFIKYYGVTTIQIQEPNIRVALVNNKDKTPIEFVDDVVINEPIQMLISSDVDNINQDAKLSYIYRINDIVQEGTGNSLMLDVDPNKSYKIDIVVQDTNGEANATKSFTINKDKAPIGLESNLVSATLDRFPYLNSDRFRGIMVLGVIGSILFVMTRQSRLIHIHNKNTHEE